MTNQPPPLDAERVSDERLAYLIATEQAFSESNGDVGVRQECQDIAAALRELQRLRATQRESGGDASLNETCDALEGMAMLFEQGDQDTIEDVAIDYLRDAARRLRAITTSKSPISQESLRDADWILAMSAAAKAVGYNGNVPIVAQPQVVEQWLRALSASQRKECPCCHGTLGSHPGYVRCVDCGWIEGTGQRKETP